MICRTRRNSFFQAGLRYENVGRWGGDGGRKEGNGLERVVKHFADIAWI